MNDTRIKNKLPAGCDRRHVPLIHTIERDGFALEAFQDPTDHGSLLASGLCRPGRAPMLGSKLKAADGREAIVCEVDTEIDSTTNQFLNLYVAARFVAKAPVVAVPVTVLDRILEIIREADPEEAKEIKSELEALIDEFETRRRWRWCEHIKRVGGEWDFGVWAGDLAGWTVCPICGARRPKGD